MQDPVKAKKISDSMYQITCPECGGTTNFRESSIGGSTRCRNCGLHIMIAAKKPSGGCLQSCLGCGILAVIGVFGLLLISLMMPALDDVPRQNASELATESVQDKLPDDLKLEETDSGKETSGEKLPTVAEESNSEQQNVESKAKADEKPEAGNDVQVTNEEVKSGHITKHKLRTWKSASGTYEKVAGFWSRSGDKVTLELENGTKIKVSIDKLSDEDKDYLQQKMYKNE